MFCENCQNVFNLDILISTHANYVGMEEPGSYPHHESFAAVEESAEAGYDICQHVCAAISEDQRHKMKLLTGEGAKIRFEF